MERSRLTRFTVDRDPSALPYVQGYVDDGRRIWWDLNYMFVAMQKHGEKKEEERLAFAVCTSLRHQRDA